MFHTADVSPASAAQERPEQDILRAASPSEELISIELASASSDNSPGVRDGLPWTAEEDEAIMEGVRKFGLKWQQIAQRLPGRSANAVRNRYLRCLPQTHEGVPVTKMPSRGGVPRSARNAAAAASSAAHQSSTYGGRSYGLW